MRRMLTDSSPFGKRFLVGRRYIYCGLQHFKYESTVLLVAPDY